MSAGLSQKENQRKSKKIKENHGVLPGASWWQGRSVPSFHPVRKSRLNASLIKGSG
jgi:hypothetical protein